MGVNISKEYIAGFVDGEGYLSIRKHTAKQVSSGYELQPIVKVAQVERYGIVLYKLQERYGGHISKPRMGGNRKPTLTWELSGHNNIHAFLADVGEALILKKPLVELVREFISVGKVTNSLSHAQREHIYAERERIYKLCKDINRRGLAETE